VAQAGRQQARRRGRIVTVIAHVVLFTPHADLTSDGWRGLLDSLVRTAHSVPAVRRFRVGRRVTHGLPGYEQAMRDNYEYAAIVEFDDLDALKSYLVHPAHLDLGAHFTRSAARALAYDYEVIEAAGETLMVER
jgi:hypothetical protein